MLFLFYLYNKTRANAWNLLRQDLEHFLPFSFLCKVILVPMLWCLQYLQILDLPAVNSLQWLFTECVICAMQVENDNILTLSFTMPQQPQYMQNHILILNLYYFIFFMIALS